MKLLRVLHLLALFIVLLPVIVVFEIGFLIWCIRTARYFEQPAKAGVKHWMMWLKEGIRQNKDFVLNGL